MGIPIENNFSDPRIRAELPRHIVNDARELQRRALTFTEIADLLNVERWDIVKALYWDRVKR